MQRVLSMAAVAGCLVSVLTGHVNPDSASLKASAVTTPIKLAATPRLSTAKKTSTPRSTATSSALATGARERAAAQPTSFGFGINADLSSQGLGGWTKKVGVPWSYAYRYLGGGAGTSSDWSTLQPNASYPISYAQTAAAQGDTPVFTYYQMLAGATPCSGCGEPQQDLTNLNSTEAMSLYFQDFALLMERLGAGTYDGQAGYGKDAIVHVEPDLSGFAENAVLGQSPCFGFCTGKGNSPSLLTASVASSGYALAATYPNTYQGFNETLLKIRDTYAPNVRLAFHISNWATGYDLNSSTDSTLDATALGKEAAQFAEASGVTYTDGTHSTYDLLFNDVSHADAGYYTYVLNKPRFWDQDNTVFPNFHRWENYIQAVTSATGKKAIVWQVPMGNQVMASESNTVGHYQDNRVQYLFDHVQELASAGLEGALFGSGISGQTSYADIQGDGVTNPQQICNSDGWSSGKVVCSSTQTTASDDDGGYLRSRAKTYYTGTLVPVS